MKTVVLCLEFFLIGFVLTRRGPSTVPPRFFKDDVVYLNPDQYNGIDGSKYRWPNRVVPYEISDEFSAAEKNLIDRTVKEQFSKTCVTVRPYNRLVDDYYVRVIVGEGCNSPVGCQRSISKPPQLLRFNKTDCMSINIVHEFTHAIGFHHQHCASERDKYVTIHYENIISGLAFAFDKQNNTQNYSVEYDYRSVMHYSQYAFSKQYGVKQTITTNNASYQNVIGQNHILTKSDILKINRMYDCPDPKF